MLGTAFIYAVVLCHSEENNDSVNSFQHLKDRYYVLLLSH